VVRFTQKEKGNLFRALMDVIPEYRGQIRIFTPRCSLYSLSRHYENDEVVGYPCRGGIDYFYVDAESAYTFPCGFRGTENLGKFQNISRNTLSEEPFCRKCDWECFRDPSELLGPILELRKQPLSLAKRFLKNPTFSRLWWSDIRYYRACSYFSGRQPPEYTKMQKFGTQPSEEFRKVNNISRLNDSSTVGAPIRHPL
jgi:hypothetical protein